jgi:hypothetical protein
VAEVRKAIRTGQRVARQVDARLPGGRRARRRAGQGARASRLRRAA